jgi:hypothetical protein
MDIYIFWDFRYLSRGYNSRNNHLVAAAAAGGLYMFVLEKIRKKEKNPNTDTQSQPAGTFLGAGGSLHIKQTRSKTF